MIERDMEENRAELDENYYEMFKSWIASSQKISFDDTQIHRLADPTDGKFDYPIHRRRNKQNVALLRKAEANLDAIWAAVDQSVSDGMQSLLDLVAHLLNNDRSIQRTPEWVEAENTMKPVQQEEYVYRPFSALFHDRNKQITGTFDRASLSNKGAKVKTTGVAAAEADADEQAPENALETTEPTTIPVDKRAHKVFRTMFHSPNNPDTPGEIPWTDFLHSMVSVGFSAEKLHGSAWSFTPRALNTGLERSNKFHEPHPVSKVPYLVARRYGRRLARAYGWGYVSIGVMEMGTVLRMVAHVDLP